MLTKQQWGLVLALLVTLGLTWLASQEESADEIAMPTRQLSSSREGASAVPTSSALRIEKRARVAMQADLFAVEKRVVALSKPTASAARPSAPALPPLPFKYLGSWQDQSAQVFSLDYQGDTLTVKVGDVVASQYKLVAAQESASGTQLQFLYLPLNKIQTMQIGAI